MRLVSVSPSTEKNLDSTEFLPESSQNAEEVLGRLHGLAGEIADAHLSKLIDSFLSNAEFMKEFRRAPAAVSIHHAYIGGLMEHTLNVALVAKALSQIYSGVDKDLLIAGAILHDVGKIREYDYMTAFRFSTEGRLMGHHVLGCEIVRDAAAKITGFPPELLMKLEHIILSHHGTKEWGSPVEPMFTEAMLLHCADLIDARHHVYATAEPEPAGNGWSSYDRQLGHYIYLGPDGESE
jgi:3'-5' exoribonuclease